MKEFFIDSDGIKLHAKLDRPDESAQGPLCILVHGFTGHMEEPHIVAMQQAMNELYPDTAVPEEITIQVNPPVELHTDDIPAAQPAADPAEEATYRRRRRTNADE